MRYSRRQPQPPTEGGVPPKKGVTPATESELGEAARKSVESVKGAEAAPTDLAAAAKAADDAAKARSSLMKQAVQQATESERGGRVPPERPKEKAAPPIPPERYTQGDKSTIRTAGETLNRRFDNLSRNAAARTQDYFNRIKELFGKSDTLMGKGGEDIYHAIQSGEYDKLPPAQRKQFEEFGGGKYDQEIAKDQQELMRRGKMPAEELNDPNYVTHMRRMPFTWDRFTENLRKGDPFGMLAGMGKPDVFKPLEFRGGTAADGTKIVVHDISPDKFAVWDKDGQHVRNARQRQEGAQGFNTGDKFEYNGKTYTADRGDTRLISKFARDKAGEPIRYHENAVLAKIEQHQQLRSAA